MSVDPVTLAVIQAGCSRSATRWTSAFSRAAFSPVIAEADDRSDGIYDAVDGSLIAQGCAACRSSSARCSSPPAT
jgi:N-methylhydantoinase B